MQRCILGLLGKDLNQKKNVANQIDKSIDNELEIGIWHGGVYGLGNLDWVVIL